MTNAQIEAIYKANLGNGHLTALAAVYTQGWYGGAGTTLPTSGPALDRAGSAAAPTSIVSLNHRG